MTLNFKPYYSSQLSLPISIFHSLTPFLKISIPQLSTTCYIFSSDSVNLVTSFLVFPNDYRTSRSECFNNILKLSIPTTEVFSPYSLLLCSLFLFVEMLCSIVTRTQTLALYLTGLTHSLPMFNQLPNHFQICLYNISWIGFLLFNPIPFVIAQIFFSIS